MGEDNEQSPLALITGAPVHFSDIADHYELTIPPEDDMYKPVIYFDRLTRSNGGRKREKAPR